MTRMLDILEDYLTLRSYSYRRLDGTVSATDRTASRRYERRSLNTAL